MKDVKSLAWQKVQLRANKVPFALPTESERKKFFSSYIWLSIQVCSKNIKYERVPCFWKSVNPEKGSYLAVISHSMTCNSWCSFLSAQLVPQNLVSFRICSTKTSMHNRINWFVFRLHDFWSSRSNYQQHVECGTDSTCQQNKYQ